MLGEKGKKFLPKKGLQTGEKTSRGECSPREKVFSHRRLEGGDEKPEKGNAQRVVEKSGERKIPLKVASLQEGVPIRESRIDSENCRGEGRQSLLVSRKTTNWGGEETPSRKRFRGSRVEESNHSFGDHRKEVEIPRQGLLKKSDILGLFSRGGGNAY